MIQWVNPGALNDVSSMHVQLKLASSALETARRSDEQASAQQEALAEAVTVNRRNVTDNLKKVEQCFDDINSENALSEEKFMELVKEPPGLELLDHAIKLFDHTAGEDLAEIVKEKSLSMMRPYYKVVRLTMLSDELAIKSKLMNLSELN